MNTYAASIGPGRLFEQTWNFFAVGGFFMVLLAIASVVAVTVILYKFLALRRERVLPERLERVIDRLGDRTAGNDSMAVLTTEARAGRCSLGRLGAVAMRHAGEDREQMTRAVEASAREEILRLQLGLPMLEVVITVAPMLGLLGTASGLVVVFDDFGVSSDPASITRGIARALNTTIVGLAVALPCVVAHSYFDRRIERFIARLEVLLDRLSKHLADERGPAAARTEPAAAPQP
jgi:biopolymer transport protein ExbB